jgi:uncharacterized protein (TIGR00725 family)
MRIPLVAVIGSGSADETLTAHAREVGRAIAVTGAGIVTGGRGGVMEAASQGAHDVLGSGTGRIVGILPGGARDAANQWLDLVLPTGMGHARNVLVVMSADAVVAVGGESGTLSEMAHAWHLGRAIGAYVPAGGWGARLAGQPIDDRRDAIVEPLRSPTELCEWLVRIVPGLRGGVPPGGTES